MSGFNKFLEPKDKIQCLFCLSSREAIEVHQNQECPDCGRSVLSPKIADHIDRTQIDQIIKSKKFNFETNTLSD